MVVRRFCGCLGLCMLALSAASMPDRALGQNPPAVPERPNPDRYAAARQLEELKKKISREEARLGELRARERQIQSQLEKIDRDQSLAREERARLAEAMSALDQEVLDTQERLEENQRGIDRLKRILSKRIVAIYKTRRRSTSLDYLFSSDSATELLKRAHYLTAIAEQDQTYLDKLSAAVATLNETEQRLTALKQEKAERLEQAKTLERQLEDQRVVEASLLREERQKAKLQLQALEKLRSSAKNLEGLLAEIIDQGGIPGVPQPVKIVRATKPPEPVRPVPRVEPPVPEPPPEPGPAPFSGKGLARLKGRLPFPVEGKLVRRFGRQHHEEFADMLFVKGLEVRAPVGARVRAVADGKAIFSGSLPGYGTVIILDHGQRYYTLYGRLKQVMLQAGDQAESGAVIAELGQPDDKGRNFYFELRIQGKAANPSGFFAKLPDAASG